MREHFRYSNQTTPSYEENMEKYLPFQQTRKPIIIIIINGEYAQQDSSIINDTPNTGKQEQPIPIELQCNNDRNTSDSNHTEKTWRQEVNIVNYVWKED